MQILQLDVQGFPQKWLSLEKATGYFATGSVVWTVGEPCFTMRGGTNSATGDQSLIDLYPIIAVNGSSRENLFDVVPSLTNEKLFKRDRFTCTYCGSVHPHGHGLTRDHIIPTSRNGTDTWINTTSACGGCNRQKADRLLEECGMELLMAPYVPSVFEDFILKGRNIRGDVHDWLASRVSKNSRWYTKH
jgi:5-methylcytosine-specific restriction endonuclease McrA